MEPNYYTKLFNYMAENYGLTLLNGEMDDLIDIVNEVERDLEIKIENANSGYPLLAGVLDDWIRDLETEDIFLLPKLLEKMKSFRVKHFS